MIVAHLKWRSNEWSFYFVVYCSALSRRCSAGLTLEDTFLAYNCLHDCTMLISSTEQENHPFDFWQLLGNVFCFSVPFRVCRDCSMASPAKSSRSRKLPSPNGRNQDLSTNSGRNYNKNHKQEENGLSDMDALSAYVPGMWLLNFYISLIKYFKNHNGK